MNRAESLGVDRPEVGWCRALLDLFSAPDNLAVTGRGGDDEK